MKLFKLTKKFHNEEDGAVTVDWVVLTAAIVGLGLAVMATVKCGAKTLASKISNGLGAVTVERPATDRTSRSDQVEGRCRKGQRPFRFWQTASCRGLRTEVATEPKSSHI